MGENNNLGTGESSFNSLEAQIIDDDDNMMMRLIRNTYKYIKIS